MKFGNKINSEKRNRLQLKTILNRVQKHQSFVYGPMRLVQGAQLEIEVEMRTRANSRAKCSGCGRPVPGYDTLPTRRFEFVPLWGIAVYFLYAMRRVDCTRCGIRVVRVPCATGKNQLTTSYAWFLARWARRLSWKEVAEVFHTSLEKVFRAVEMAVAGGGPIRSSPASRPSASMKSSGSVDTATSRWSIGSVQAADGCCGSVRTAR